MDVDRMLFGCASDEQFLDEISWSPCDDCELNYLGDEDSRMAYKKDLIRLSVAVDKDEYKRLKELVKMYGCRSMAAYFRMKLKQDINYLRGVL